MDIRITMSKENAERLKKAFGPYIRIKTMRGTKEKVFIYLNNVDSSYISKIGETLTDFMKKDAERKAVYDEIAAQVKKGLHRNQGYLAIGMDAGGNSYRTVGMLLTQDEFDKLNEEMCYSLDDDDEWLLVHGRDYDND